MSESAEHLKITAQAIADHEAGVEHPTAEQDNATVNTFDLAAEALASRGLPDTLAQFVTGQTVEEIAEQLDLLESLRPAPRATRTPNTPAGGLTPYDEPDRFDKDSFLSDYNRSRGWTY